VIRTRGKGGKSNVVFDGAVTVTVAVPLALFDEAVIVAVPSPVPETVAVRPFAVAITLATFGSLLVHVTGEVSSTRTFAPNLRFTVAFIVPVAFTPPRMSDSELGKTSTR
jgi:hypothetical protein